MLAGGVGAAKFLRGLSRRIDQRYLSVIVNTGDDEEFFGLHVSPDVDTVVYTLAGIVNRANGWGLEGDSFNALEALARFYGKPWFNLGDRDIATNLYRSERLRAGAALSEVTREITSRLGVRAHIMPMTDARVRTFVRIKGRPSMPFQEYFVRRRARGMVEAIELRGADEAPALPEALSAMENADKVILAPSNPFVSLGPILQLKDMRPALRAKRDQVVAISPIVGGKTVKGPADRMLRGLGHEVSPLGVAKLYRDFVGVFVLDQRDRRFAQSINELGMRAVVTDTIMLTPAHAARLADVVLRAREV
ncbi:MAG: 2-phospho-L-lactate transferase [Candidatus Binataceae bacterium]